MKNTALLLVDFQNDYFSSFKDAKFPLENSEEASLNAKLILDIFRQKQFDVIHVFHENEALDARFFAKGTSGAKIYFLLTPLENEKVISKNRPNSFLDTDLKEHLDENEINTLVIVGAMSHMCIDATVRAAKDFGYNCIVVSDACATKELEYDKIKIPAKYVHGTIMSALEFAYANVTDTKNILEGL